MEEELAHRAERALGPDWLTFGAVVASWMEKNRESLRSGWSYPIDDEELLNHELGVFIHDPGDTRQTEIDYSATPRDSFAFARTGMDGEHYSVLLDDGCVGVIVLTVPMAFDNEHVVVGESFSEALSLVSGGCGLAVPPGIAYGAWDRTLAVIKDSSDNSLWRELRSGMGLMPWPDPASRLAELREEYHPLVHRRRD